MALGLGRWGRRREKKACDPPPDLRSVSETLLDPDETQLTNVQDHLKDAVVSTPVERRSGTAKVDDDEEATFFCDFFSTIWLAGDEFNEGIAVEDVSRERRASLEDRLVSKRIEHAGEVGLIDKVTKPSTNGELKYDPFQYNQADPSTEERQQGPRLHDKIPPHNLKLGVEGYAASNAREDQSVASAGCMEGLGSWDNGQSMASADCMHGVGDWDFLGIASNLERMGEPLQKRASSCSSGITKQAFKPPAIHSKLHSDVEASESGRCGVSFHDGGIARIGPGIPASARSPGSVSSKQKFVSSAISSSTALNKQGYKSAVIQSKMSPPRNKPSVGLPGSAPPKRSFMKRFVSPPISSKAALSEQGCKSAVVSSKRSSPANKAAVGSPSSAPSNRSSAGRFVSPVISSSTALGKQDYKSPVIESRMSSPTNTPIIGSPSSAPSNRSSTGVSPVTSSSTALGKQGYKSPVIESRMSSPTNTSTIGSPSSAPLALGKQGCKSPVIESMVSSPRNTPTGGSPSSAPSALGKQGCTSPVIESMLSSPTNTPTVGSPSSAPSNRSSASTAIPSSTTPTKQDSPAISGTAAPTKQGCQSPSVEIKPPSCLKSDPDLNTPIVETCRVLKSKASMENSITSGSSGKSSTIKLRSDGSLSSEDLACAATSIGEDATTASSSTHTSSLSTLNKSAVESNARKVSFALNPVYPSDRNEDVASDASTTLLSQGSNDSLSTVSGNMNSTDSCSNTLSRILSVDVDDVCLTNGVLDRIAKSQNVTVDSVVESVCDKLDDMESALFDVGAKKKPTKRWFKGFRVVVIW